MAADNLFPMLGMLGLANFGNGTVLIGLSVPPTPTALPGSGTPTAIGLLVTAFPPVVCNMPWLMIVGGAAQSYLAVAARRPRAAIIVFRIPGNGMGHSGGFAEPMDLQPNSRSIWLMTPGEV